MKQNYDNPLRRQCFDIVNLAPIQFELLHKAFIGLMQPEKMSLVTRIIVTGCGDSYLAAMESKEVFKKLLHGTGCHMEVRRAIDVARYLQLGDNETDTLIVAISASGGPARIAEILQRGKKHGCMTMALTANPSSRAAELADYVFTTNTPDFADQMPGLRNYMASMAGLYVMAALLGEAKTGKVGIYKEMYAKLVEYNGRFAAELDSMDNAAFAAADSWKTLHGFEVVADGPMFCCGEFISAKYAEVSGDKCTVVDSENFWHVNSILRPLGGYGTMTYMFSDEANFSRMQDTVNRSVCENQRSVMLICDKPATEMGITEPVVECIMPIPEKEYRYLLPLYAYVPGSLAAGYQAALIDEPYFRGGGKFFDPAINTLKSNEIHVL